MSALATLVRDITDRLSRESARFALVGGLAVSARTEPRFTRDVDLVVVANDDQESSSIIATLVPPFRVLEILEHERLGRLAAVRLGTVAEGDSGPVLDLLFASSGIEAEIAMAATMLELFPGVDVPIARTGHLIALKLLSRDLQRPQDEGDLQRLVATANDGEIEVAYTAARLIVERNANRGRNLAEDLTALLATHGGKGKIS